MSCRLGLQLEKGSLVLIDSAPLVYLVEGGSGPSPRGGAASSVFAALKEGGLELIASTLLWTELLAGPLAEGKGELADRYRRLLADSSFLRLVPLDVAIAEEAARLMAEARARKAGLALADSVHLATAAVEGAAALLTNDGGLREAAEALRPGREGKKGGRPALPEVLLFDELAYRVEAD